MSGLSAIEVGGVEGDHRPGWVDWRLTRELPAVHKRHNLRLRLQQVRRPVEAEHDEVLVDQLQLLLLSLVSVGVRLVVLKLTGGSREPARPPSEPLETRARSRPPRPPG